MVAVGAVLLFWLPDSPRSVILVIFTYRKLVRMRTGTCGSSPPWWQWVLSCSSGCPSPPGQKYRSSSLHYYACALPPVGHLHHGGSGCRPSLLAARVPQVSSIGRLYTITHAQWHLHVISAMVAVGAVLLFWLPESPRSEI